MVGKFVGTRHAVSYTREKFDTRGFGFSIAGGG